MNTTTTPRPSDSSANSIPNKPRIPLSIHALKRQSQPVRIDDKLSTASGTNGVTGDGNPGRARKITSNGSLIPRVNSSVPTVKRGSGGREPGESSKTGAARNGLESEKGLRSIKGNIGSSGSTRTPDSSAFLNNPTPTAGSSFHSSNRTNAPTASKAAAPPKITQTSSRVSDTTSPNATTTITQYLDELVNPKTNYGGKSVRHPSSALRNTPSGPSRFRLPASPTQTKASTTQARPAKSIPSTSSTRGDPPVHLSNSRPYQPPNSSTHTPSNSGQVRSTPAREHTSNSSLNNQTVTSNHASRINEIQTTPRKRQLEIVSPQNSLAKRSKASHSVISTSRSTSRMNTAIIDFTMIDSDDEDGYGNEPIEKVKEEPPEEGLKHVLEQQVTPSQPFQLPANIERSQNEQPSTPTEVTARSDEMNAPQTAASVPPSWVIKEPIRHKPVRLNDIWVVASDPSDKFWHNYPRCSSSDREDDLIGTPEWQERRQCLRKMSLIKQKCNGRKLVILPKKSNWPFLKRNIRMGVAGIARQKFQYLSKRDLRPPRNFENFWNGWDESRRTIYSSREHRYIYFRSGRFDVTSRTALREDDLPSSVHLRIRRSGDSEDCATMLHQLQGMSVPGPEGKTAILYHSRPIDLPESARMHLPPSIKIHARFFKGNEKWSVGQGDFESDWTNFHDMNGRFLRRLNNFVLQSKFDGTSLEISPKPTCAIDPSQSLGLLKPNIVAKQNNNVQIDFQATQTTHRSICGLKDEELSMFDEEEEIATYLALLHGGNFNGVIERRKLGDRRTITIKLVSFKQPTGVRTKENPTASAQVGAFTDGQTIPDTASSEPSQEMDIDPLPGLIMQPTSEPTSDRVSISSHSAIAYAAPQIVSESDVMVSPSTPIAPVDSTTTTDRVAVDTIDRSETISTKSTSTHAVPIVQSQAGSVRTITLPDSIDTLGSTTEMEIIPVHGQNEIPGESVYRTNSTPRQGTPSGRSAVHASDIGSQAALPPATIPSTTNENNHIASASAPTIFESAIAADLQTDSSTDRPTLSAAVESRPMTVQIDNLDIKPDITSLSNGLAGPSMRNRVNEYTKWSTRIDPGTLADLFPALDEVWDGGFYRYMIRDQEESITWTRYHLTEKQRFMACCWNRWVFQRGPIPASDRSEYYNSFIRAYGNVMHRAHLDREICDNFQVLWRDNYISVREMHEALKIWDQMSGFHMKLRKARLERERLKAIQAGQDPDSLDSDSDW
ncbi:uncharacterized protein IL334_004807 [Kwoniella shivajii]|uniref:Polycomb protein VEFS-Box domain-containing protein n=1 Tax=Kwoniella shivajii TaxID=564305 RepID=A0ABZ1D1I6_9TREE|nr:hypothetical protein IL334_004807 [Kwoniella shivajii]